MVLVLSDRFVTHVDLHGHNRHISLTSDYVHQKRPEVYSRDLIEVVFTQPYCRIANLVEAGIAKRQTASVYLKKLVEIGVLEEIKSGREKLFIHPKLIKAVSTDKHFENY